MPHSLHKMATFIHNEGTWEAEDLEVAEVVVVAGGEENKQIMRDNTQDKRPILSLGTNIQELEVEASKHD